MDADKTVDAMQGPGRTEPDTLGGVLTAAVNMEEDISAGVYRDYLDPGNWPDQLDEKAFAEIRKRLTVLLKGIEQHKRIIRALVREHGAGK